MCDPTWVPLRSTTINSLVVWLNDHLFDPALVRRITENNNSVLVTFQDDTWIRISIDQLETKEVPS